MSRTITAMFDSRNEAESARSQLVSSSIEADRVRIIDQSTAGDSQSRPDGQQEGIWASIKDMFMPDEDRHAYSEGIRRGHVMLVAEVDEQDADEACRVLEQSDGVDFDQRQAEWRGQGWTGYQADRPTGAFGQLGSDQDAKADRSDRTVAEEHIPIVEEELKIGKREVNRGGARVRSYVRETPVHEQVTLRDEHVSVERRPMNETMSAGDLNDAFRDREIDMKETSEEAVIGKEARAREELVVRKTAGEHTESIDDSVRRTEVDVDEGERGALFNKDRDESKRSKAERERAGQKGGY